MLAEASPKNNTKWRSWKEGKLLERTCGCALQGGRLGPPQK